MKVAIVSTSVSRGAGGILPIMQNHAIELTRLGIDVSVHGVLDKFGREDAASWGGVPLHLVSSVGPERFAYAPSLLRSIAAADPDIVHQHGIWQYTSVAVSKWRHRTGRPVVISVQGMLEPWAMHHSRMKKRLAGILFEQRNLRHAAAIHASRFEVEGVRAHLPTVPVAVLPNGARVAAFGELRRPEFMKNDGRRTLLFLGRLHPKKGISETLKAWQIFKKLAPELASGWKLAVVGWDDGGHFATLLAEASALGLSEDVVFPGALYGEEKEAALHFADAFILPSHSEGFPMAVMEAFAHALPVFMTRECNIPEAFEFGAAFEIRPDPELLASTFSRDLGRSVDELKVMGRRGAELVATRFSWEGIAVQLDGLYRYLLGQSPAQPQFLI